MYLPIKTAKHRERININPANQIKKIRSVRLQMAGNKANVQFARVRTGEMDYKRPVTSGRITHSKLFYIRSKHSLLNHKFAKCTTTTLKTNH